MCPHALFSQAQSQMVLVKCNCMHATGIIVICYDKLSIQQCLCIENATKLKLKGGFCRDPPLVMVG